MKRLSIVIPAYNEEGNIDRVIERLLRQKPKISSVCPEISNIELIVVNDNSKDKTAEVVQRYPEVILVTHVANRGYGAALKTGFARAKGEYIGFLDADGTYPPESLFSLCEALIKNKADIVLGSRLSGEKSRMSLLRYFGNRFYAVLLSWLTDKKISDTATGMRVFKKEILSKVYPLPDGLNFTPAMSTQALNEDLKICEVPITYEKREGSSKLNILKDGYRFLMSIVLIARLYNPLKFFGPIGIVFLFLAIALSIKPISYYLVHRLVLETSIYRLITVVVLFVAGFNTISLGIVANNVVSIIHRKEQKKDILHKLIYERAYKHLNFVGLLLVFAGIMLNHKTVFQYATMRKIYVHWSYLLTGAVLILSGIQLYVFNVLIKIIDELKKRYKNTC